MTLKSETKGENTKKVFIKTYGCQMNVYDSERMGDAMGAEGYVQTEEVDDADLVLLNTCLAKTGKDTMIGVAGCVAQAEGQEIINRSPVVDFVVGPQTYHRLPNILDRSLKGEKVVETEYAVEDKFEHLPSVADRPKRTRAVTSFLTVQEGCDKFCTFCVVPYTRGAEQSRSVETLLDEARKLTDAGVKEITLLGQNVNAWHGQGKDGREWGLGELLHALAETVPGIERLRYTTSHPRDMDDALIEAHRDLPILMPYLHLPFEAGRDLVVKAMNRQHTRESYFDMIDRIRAARPDIAMSGDFIVGFPGETDADFEDTLDLVRRVTYAQAFSFKYSPRPGTPGADMDNHVPAEVASERLQRLQELLNEQQYAFNRSKEGTQMDVLIEKRGNKPGQMIGRSPWLQSVIIDRDDLEVGDILPVAITHGAPNSLNGDLLLDDPH